MTDDLLEYIASKFDGRVREADGWRVLCPIHADRNPSLSIRLGDKGVVAICRAGCETSEVLAARGLTFADLFETPPDGHHNGNGLNGNGKSSSLGRIAATYDYTDEHGELLYQVVRYDPKNFRQRRPDEIGGWIFNLGSTRRVLYRLPKVLAAVAEGAPVWIVEGEKDVAALERAGEAATTCAMGAGKWRAEYTDTLKEANVIICADDDPPGIDHAHKVAEALRPVVATIAMRLPALGHKDIADHLGAGLALGDLRTFGTTTTTTSTTGIAAIDWSAFWSAEAPEEDWLIEPLVPRGRQVALYSAAKAGKSLLSLEIAAAAAAGRPVLDRPACAPVDVVYIDQEMTAADLRERLIDLGYSTDSDLSHLHYYQLTAIEPLNTKAGADELIAIVKDTGAQLVVIDTMARVVAGDENDADPYRDFYRHTGVALKALGVALLRLDHEGKDKLRGQRGSSAKVDDVDIVIQLTVLDGGMVRLKRTHSRVPWVPAETTLTRHDTPLLTHSTSGPKYPAGTVEAARALDELGVPVDTTVAGAQTTLRAAGQGARKQIVSAAVRYRREAK